MADCPGNLSYPGQWFVRSRPFACLCPAPFFAVTHTLASGDTLELRYRVAIADGRLGQADCVALAGLAAQHTLAAPAASPQPGRGYDNSNRQAGAR